MLRRLKPPHKIDKATGKVLPDYIDEDGIGRLKNRKWFSHVKHKGKTIDVSLDANERELQKAVMNLGLLLQDLLLGKVPNGTRKKVKFLKPEKPFRKEYADIRKNYIDPFFGEMKPNELKPEVIEKYIESRWGRNNDGNLQAMERTLKTELWF